MTMTRPRGTAPPGSASGSGRDTGGLRLAGIRIRLTPGSYLIAMLVVLAGALALPDAAPGWPVVAYLTATAGLVAGLLLSLTAHELAHALTARRYGMDVGELRIGLAGSAGHVRGEFTSPRAAWRVAAAGPAASLAVTVVCAAATLGLGAVGAGQLAASSFAALMWINVVLTVANALPGTGLDGGRVVQGLAWARSGDLARATATASRVGQYTGALLVAGGVASIALGYIGGLLAALIGLMMIGTSRAQAREVPAARALAGLRVRDVLRPAGTSAPAAAWQTVQAFLDSEFAGVPGHSMGHGLGEGGPVAFPLHDAGGGAAGVVTLTQLAAVPPQHRDTVRLAEIATGVGDVVITTEDEPLSRLLPRLAVAPRTPAAMHTAGHALVLDPGGRPAGVLTPADFSRASRLAPEDLGRPGP